jgi:hypothetical protein
MHSSYAPARSQAADLSTISVPRDLAALAWFCLLGLTISAAWISYLGVEVIGPFLLQLE